MALTTTEEALVRQLLEQQAAILSLADAESTIISKLGATKVTLADLTAASVVNDADLFLIRQGTTEKSVAGSVMKTLSTAPDASATVKGIVELATLAEVATGTDTVRAITPEGSALVTKQIQPISASVAANALTITLNPTAIDFRASSLTSGTINRRYVSSSISAVIPSGATLGTVSGQSARLALIAIDNSGTVELAISNLAGGVNLDETTLISTTAISGSSNSASVIYSTTARSSVPFRVVGFIDISEATAGTWATAPTVIQGAGGNAIKSMQSLGYSQVLTSFTVGTQRVNNTTYYNTTGRPILVSIYGSSTTSASTITVNGVQAWLLTSPTGNMSCGTSIIVPPGGSYIANFTNTLSGWSELR